MSRTTLVTYCDCLLRLLRLPAQVETGLRPPSRCTQLDTSAPAPHSSAHPCASRAQSRSLLDHLFRHWLQLLTCNVTGIGGSAHRSSASGSLLLTPDFHNLLLRDFLNGFLLQGVGHLRVESLRHSLCEETADHFSMQTLPTYRLRRPGGPELGEGLQLALLDLRLHQRHRLIHALRAHGTSRSVLYSSQVHRHLTQGTVRKTETER